MFSNSNFPAWSPKSLKVSRKMDAPRSTSHSWHASSPAAIIPRRHLNLEHLESRQLLAAHPMITEFMADNDDNVGLGEIERGFGKPDPFGDGSTPDWIEVHNPGNEVLDLAGYYLTDDAENLTKWKFPSATVEPGSYLLVYASGMDGPNFFDEHGHLHTSFGLSSGGEYLGLVAPDRTTVVSQFSLDGSDFPPQVSNVSYGLSQTTPLVTPSSPATYWIPADGAFGISWTLPEFDAFANGFSTGAASLGYEARPTDRTNFIGHFETEIPETSHAAYMRVEFGAQDASSITRLLLQLQYDNGFIAYINGKEVARDNAPDNASWSATAVSTTRRDSSATKFEDFDLSEHSDALQDGKNVLGIHLLNHLSDNTDMLLGVKLTADKPLDKADPGYLLVPTPGTSNAFVDALTGPLVQGVTENPGALADDQDLLVTASVHANNGPVGSVLLQYRIMFDHEISVAMVDDGTGADATAGDGIYSATIPASASQPGQMVRWKVIASDTENNLTRWPLFAYAEDSDEYLGTMVSDPMVTSNLTVLHWFIDDSSFRSAASARGGRGSFFYLNEFYDNVNADDHGQSTRNFPKKSYDLDFNQGNRFLWQDGQQRVRDINLLTNWGDKAKFRHALAYEMYDKAGSPAFFAFPVRVQKNGEFFSIADMVEDADDRTLERLGLNPDGALYKMYDGLTTSSQGAWEKKSRQWEDKSDLAALQEATRLRGEDWSQYAFDNLDIPEFVNFLPLFDLQTNKGCCHKNYYFYHDRGATDEWQIFIWDPDLAFGHDFKSGPGYFDDKMDWDNPLFSSRGTNNAVLKKLYESRSTPGFEEMYLRRLRTLMDELLQPSDTPYEERYLERRMDEFVGLLDPHDDPFDPTPNPPAWPDARHGTVLGTDDADLDYNAWGSWSHGNGNRLYAARGETMREHTQRIKDEHLDQRRDFLYGLPVLPEAQVGNPTLEFGVIESDPASGNQAEEYVELINSHNTAVDISGWRLTQAVDFTFPPGTVIPSGWTLHVAADKNAFRSRTIGPTGGQGLFIVGGWKGDLSDGEELTLTGADGAVVQKSVLGEAPTEIVVGDSNGDGQFDQLDIVTILQAGKYNQDVPATWSEGDWNRDGRFNQLDIVTALQADSYAAQALAADALFAKNAIGLHDGDGIDLEFNEFMES